MSPTSQFAEEDFSMTLLTSLPDSWNTFIAAIDDTALGDANKLIARILGEDRRIRSRTDDTSTAFLGKNRKKKFNLNVMCYGCNEKGHIWRNCPKVTEDSKKTAEPKKAQAHVAEEDFSFISSIETALATIARTHGLLTRA